ncbi:hypothetical protein [Klebsiella pneumoniae IS33]|nr:hypothetical protein [Klebsiella pneumoniae IS22]CDK95633.1 hypothetical protein [Klebsiella pneumoniae IS33]
MPTGASSLVTIEKAQIPSATTAIQTRAAPGGGVKQSLSYQAYP